MYRLAQGALSEEEADLHAQCFNIKSGILMRKWHPCVFPANEEWKVVCQIVVPKKYRVEMLHLAHKSAMAGHLGVNKTYLKILNYRCISTGRNFKEVAHSYRKSLHVCQVVGKPNQERHYNLCIPVCGEPFGHIIMDCIGPFPRTKSGSKYLCTTMCRFTHHLMRQSHLRISKLNELQIL